MELTSMLLNQLTGKNNITNVMNNTTNKGFEQVLNNVETKQNNQSQNVSQNESKNNSYKKDSNYKKDNLKKDNLKADNNIKKDDTNNNNVKTEEKINVENNIETTTTNTENKVKDEKDCKIEEKTKDKAIIVDEETLQKLSQILNVSPEKIMDILSSLSMSVSMLQDTKNLVKFLQATFNVDSQASLLGIDNIKNIMSDIQNIAKSIDYQDIVYIDDNFKQNLLNVINSKDGQKLNILNSQDNKNNIKEQIESLLQQLNGEVLESSSNLSDKLNITKFVDNTNIVNNPSEQTQNTNEKLDMIVISETVDFDNTQGTNTQSVETLIVDEPQPKQQNMQNNENQQNSNFANQSQQTQNKVLDQNNTQNINFKQEMFNIAEVKNDAKVFNLNMPKTQVLRNINNTEVVTQIMEKIKVSVKPEISEVKMLLKPEQLGEVSLKISTQNGVVTAQFIAESQRVKEIIEANFNQLKDMLLEQGIDVGALEVNVSDQDQQTSHDTTNGQSKNKKQTNIMFEDDLTQIDDNKISQEDAINSMVSYSI